MAQTVVSHYRVLHKLGEGGMGVVYRAEDLRLDREVAIKFLRKEDNTHAPWLTRFEREARLASALKHPHICTIHELGEEDGRPFIVMELLEGLTIKQRIEEGALPVDQVVALRGADCDGARGCTRARHHPSRHQAGEPVRHPRAITSKFSTSAWRKLTDRQAAVTTAVTQAAVQTTTDVEVTVTGAAVGTAAYMSPEQATGAKVDGRTDLFSFGSVLYEMATGRRAFPGDNTGTVIMRLLKGEFIPPRSLNPAIPERLETIILRAMEVDPNRRYQSAAGMLEDLRSLSRVLAPDVSSTAIEMPIAPAALPARRDSRIRGWIIGVAGIVLIAVVGGWRWIRPAPAIELTNKDSILVGGFGNTTGDAVFDETIGMALKVQLGQSPFLDIVPDDRVTDELRLMQRPREERLTHDVAREACERLGLKAMLDGTLAALGSNYVLTLNATDCHSGATVATRAEGSDRARRRF